MTSLYGALEVLEHEPFANDKLGRKEPIETLTNVINNIGSPFILSVDAPWGSGKTTFLKMWEKHLQNLGYAVVDFNAWETDYSDDPFLALSGEISTQLADEDETTTTKDLLRDLKCIAKDVAIRRVPNILSTLAALGTTATGAPFASEFTSDLVRGAAERLLRSHQETQDSIHAFQTRLAGLAKEVSRARNGRPIIVMIDELDRCRPTYAIELLENAKHIFNVNNVVFVLSMNQKQLAESVKAIYGPGFEAQLYLERFFDMSFNLPYLDRKNFIRNAIESTQIRGRLKAGYIEDVITAFFNDSTLNLRSIAKAILHLNLVVASLEDGERFEVEVAALLFMFRSISHDSYQRFLQGGLSDEQTSSFLFSKLNSERLLNTPEHAVYQAIMLPANQRIKGRRYPPGDVVERITSGIRNLTFEQRERLSRCACALDTENTKWESADLEGLIRRIELLTGENSPK
ncbi:MAG: P-loop NTPase fold protein [Chloroflexi bacterium]|nr:P-loop NTPase fold protein [Chloroflexota bacterium]